MSRNITSLHGRPSVKQLPSNSAPICWLTGVNPIGGAALPPFYSLAVSTAWAWGFSFPGALLTCVPIEVVAKSDRVEAEGSPERWLTVKVLFCVCVCVRRRVCVGAFFFFLHVRVKSSGQVSARLRSKLTNTTWSVRVWDVCVGSVCINGDPCVISPPPPNTSMIEMLIESVIKPILSAKTLSYEEIIAGPFIREVTALSLWFSSRWSRPIITSILGNRGVEETHLGSMTTFSLDIKKKNNVRTLAACFGRSNDVLRKKWVNCSIFEPNVWPFSRHGPPKICSTSKPHTIKFL